MTGINTRAVIGNWPTRCVVQMASAGDLISIPSRSLHAARCPVPATYVVGFESEQAARAFHPKTPDTLNA